MFIQVIQGPCSRPDEVYAVFEEWHRDHAPAADGWLGSTHGVDTEGTFVGVVRFESQEHARANSERPEQDDWARRMSACFDGAVDYRDFDDVVLMLAGGSDQAGFVQVIQGQVDDVDRLKRMVGRADLLRQLRPDLIGATLACAPDGRYVETVAFTSEEQARAGEAVTPPADVRAELAWAMAGARFHDLRDPHFLSPVDA